MTSPSQNTWDSPNPAVSAADATVAESTSTTGPHGPTKAPAGRWRDASPAREAASDYGFSMSARPEAAEATPRRGLSIGLKATALAAAFGVLPVLAVGTIAYRSANVSITERIVQQELSEVDQLADQLRQYFQERIANVSTAASFIRDSRLLENDLPPEEQATVTREVIRGLTDFVQDYRTYASVALLDLQGNVVVQSQGSARELNQREAAYFQDAIAAGTAVVSEPVPIDPNGDTTQLAIYVAIPSRLDDGTISGVISAKIPVDFVGNAILRAASSDEEGIYRLVDSSGQIFQSLPVVDETAVAGQPIADQLPLFPQVSDQRQRSAWIESTNQGEFLNAYAPLQGFSDLDWSVVTSTNTRLAFLAQQQLLKTILLGSVATGVVAVLLGVVLAKRATRPVEEAAKAVELLGQGQLHARVTVRGSDELAVLGTNVNRMGSQIQALLQTLSQNAAQLGKQNNVLAELARNEALISGDAQMAAQRFAEAIATTLTTHRVSVWLYLPEAGQLQCLSSYSQGDSVPGASVVVAEVPTYFRALADNQSLAIRQAQEHETLQELITGGHLSSDTISLLEIPIQSSGNFVGSVRCEHVGEPREWKPQEQTFVSSVGNLISLALESEFLQEEVSHLLDVVSEVEDGNLAIQAQVSDRTTGLVADTFNRLIERLSEVMQQAIETAQQVSQGANQQKSQAGLIATNAEQQADGVNQILQLINRVKDLAQDAAQRVATSRASLQTLQQTVEGGQEAITNLNTGIGILQEGSDRIIQQMKTLGEFVGLADQFVQDQTQIASLTQTLALNASLVAARAAEQTDPRQFAVAAREFSAIASQVSQLAQQTNASLTVLEQRSAQIQSVVFTVDANVQRVGSLVEGFTQGVEQSNQVFTDVQTVTVETVNAEAVVAEASQEIVGAVQSATDVVRTITDIADQTAELTLNNRMQSEHMEQLSQQLLETMVFFQLPTAPEPPAQSLQADEPTVEVTAETVTSHATGLETAENLSVS